MQNTWTAVDDLLNRSLGGDDDALTAALEATAAAGMPAINVTAMQGKLLQLLAHAVGARRILEIGTLGGYSTIWLARALAATGRLTTLELNAAYADVARANLDRAGVGDRVDVVVGPALESLQAIDDVFDFTFIDADKATTPEYFDWSVAHSRSGALVVVDNVVRQGALVDEETADDSVRGMRRFLDAAGRDDRVDVTAIQTVGQKGHDGFALAVVR
jgi:predicted O-methyltransferase YrrM